MYLKSLVLKGFKSFADRATLSLEPGITAIVGPNGSGKSNISDAVLWVLGERSARNLRGQAMEDIIFSGSAARKAVSVAEVDLVLDNSDGTLSVEFDEVVITRRMYRSGESEYLVNGVVARRLDVLDILHDTGLGTGTHSIISQGSLDSILQSRPEDRRALIEEAAGVLKHKQRKEKSARKLEQMDNHLARVRDVAGEVARQLGPLERKAKRAEAYKTASAQLADLRLAVAVDDLRKLQVQWDAVLKAESAVANEVEEQRDTVTAAEQKVNDFQELMKRESEDAGELAKRSRRANNLTERLDSAEMLVRERRRSALGYEADMRTSLDTSAARREEAKRELESASAQLDEALAASGAADARAAELAEQRTELNGRFQEAESAVNGLIAAIRECEDASDEAKRNLSLAQEGLSNGLAHMKLVEARKVELGSDLARAKEEHEKAAAAAQRAKGELADLEARESQAQDELVVRFEARDAARAAFDAAREARQVLDSEIKAIERSLAMTREDDPALMWLLDNAALFKGGLDLVSGAIKVKGDHESLVESLLGEDLAALSVQDAEQAQAIAKALADGRLTGDVSVVMRSRSGAVKAELARKSGAGRALVDELEYPEGMRPVVEALLGDVVICETRDAAFKGHAGDTAQLRYVSADGCAIWPTGKVRIYGVADTAGEGVLARERRLDDLRSRFEKSERDLAEAEKSSKAAEDAYREAQSASLKLREQLANHKGVCSSAVAEEDRTAHRLSSIARELEDIDAQVETAAKTVADLRPDVESAEKLIEELAEKRVELVRERDERSDQVAPLREEVARVGELLSEAKLACATLAERRTYAERIVAARRRDIETIDANAIEAKRSLYVKGASIKRGDELLALFERLVSSLARRTRILDEAMDASESATSTVHTEAANARDAARAAHNAYDEASARMTQVRVEKSRLEVQVEAAVAAVVRDCATPLDVAEQLPQLENRSEVEDDIFRLERRIKNMGTINPDAAEEYAQLKERYDFLAGQLADMESARRSLNRIVRVIDVRMKDDFVRTFEEVNSNFNEIFGLLFPGGTAHLSLEDPEDVEHSGVEVTAQPRGKRLTKMMLMSGGEKSLTALALLFAVYKTRTTPFYILDEVEAALDDTNLRRLIAYIDTLRSTTQLIFITHQRRTMEMADVLFGVSMQADGVTKVISQKLERALEQAT